MEWQRHFERHATPQMGRNCGFWDNATFSAPWARRVRNREDCAPGGLTAWNSEFT
jgi:hypothetical protein